MDRIEREISLPAPPERVWEALTEPEALSSWFGARAELVPRPRARVTFRWEDGRERAAVVEEADHGRRLAFRWLPFERLPGGGHRAVGPGRVEITLEPQEEGTRLRVTEWGPGTGSPPVPPATLSRVGT